MDLCASACDAWQMASVTTAWISGTLAVPEPSAPSVVAVMRGNRKRNTRPELRLRSELHRRGLRFRKDYQIRVGGRSVRADVVFTRQKLAVFIDGCFWHRCPDHGTAPRSNVSYWRPKLDRNVARDIAQTAALEAVGWLVVRVWEHESPGQAAGRVLTALCDADASHHAPSD